MTARSAGTRDGDAVIVGILSDSHGQAARTGVAVRMLRELGAAAMVHCGDVGGPAVLDELASGVPARFVWGNMDDADAPTERYAAAIGLTPPGAPPVLWELADRRLAIFHGHEPRFERLRRALRDGDENASAAAERADYVLYGHTHRAADERFGSLRLINPGALQRARTYTVATLDLASDTVVHWIVPSASEPGPPQRFEMV